MLPRNLIAPYPEQDLKEAILSEAPALAGAVHTTPVMGMQRGGGEKSQIWILVRNGLRVM